MVDITKVIQQAGYKVTDRDLGSFVFPDLEHPVLKMWKVRTGRCEITEAQLGRLAEYLGVELSTMQGGMSWKRKKNVHTFTSEDGHTVATYNTYGGVFTLVKNGKTEISETRPDMTLNELINYITE